MKFKTLILLPAILIFALSSIAQKPDKGFFKEYESGYYINHIMKDARVFEESQKTKEVDKRFFMNQDDYELPNKLDLYKSEWHFPPISQGNTGTCWCFSNISFYESEIYRLSGKKVKLSEMYVVYWEYVEKARRFVKERGHSNFSQGSEGNGVTRMFNKYGIVPHDVYDGLEEGRKFHNHSLMFKEMSNYLKFVKNNAFWNEEEVIETIKAIENHYIGEPPVSFEYEGKEVTPMQFLNDILQLNTDNYIELLSIMQQPYWEMVEYEVADNWWHSEDYFNVPLDDYMSAIRKAIEEGYTMSIGGDVSEAGFLRTTNCAMIPTFDIPSEFIDENARQFRFSNHTTTDDHGMHLVGYLKDGDDYWYLIKDSSSGSRNLDEDDPAFGYYFFHEDFIKLKMMNISIHKEAIKGLLKKLK